MPDLIFLKDKHWGVFIFFCEGSGWLRKIGDWFIISLSNCRLLELIILFFNLFFRSQLVSFSIACFGKFLLDWSKIAPLSDTKIRSSALLSSENYIMFIFQLKLNSFYLYIKIFRSPISRKFYLLYYNGSIINLEKWKK